MLVNNLPGLGLQDFSECPLQGGLAATFDLAAFRKDMIAPVKKSVNHSKTVTSMREMRRIQCHFVRGDSTVENVVVFSYCLFTVSMFFFCGSTKFEHYDNQDRWNEVSALF